MDADTAWRVFLMERESEGRSPRTIEALGEGWAVFKKWAAAESVPLDLGQWSPDTVKRWHKWMSDQRKAGLDGKPTQRWSQVTRATWSRHLHNFLTYAHEGRGWISWAPPKAVREPRNERPALNATQMESVVKAASHGRNAMRNKALVMTALATGVRLGELAHLTIDDVDWQAGLLRVRPETSKSRRLRYVPLGHQARMALYEYVQFKRGPYPYPSLFLGETGEPLDRRGLQMIVRRVARRAGLKVYMHMFRHTFATQSILSGVPLPYVQSVLGHQALSTTAVYLDQTAMQQAVARMNWAPTDSLSRGR